MTSWVETRRQAMQLADAARPSVLEKLGEAQRLAEEYVERCAAFYAEGAPKGHTKRPHPPRGLDRRIAAMIRDEVEEAALVERASARTIEAAPRRAAQRRREAAA